MFYSVRFDGSTWDYELIMEVLAKVKNQVKNWVI